MVTVRSDGLYCTNKLSMYECRSASIIAKFSFLLLVVSVPSLCGVELACSSPPT
jgi:hypothetical protein